MEHDQRYERAEEYLDVVYQLWEHSWEEDAIVRGHVNDVHTGPAKVHEINYTGTYFNVPGPHMCEPSPQRTPVLYQAGQSVRQIVKDRAQAAGIAGRISGHSLRVGTAQSLAREGAGEVEMQTMGRWKSPTMPALYARKQLARRGAVARLRYGITS